jgi:methyl-accepting chemotaxis protein
MKRKSLGFKLNVAGLLLVLIPVSVVGSYAVLKTSNSLSGIFQDSSVRTAQAVAELCQSALSKELKLTKEISVGNTPIDVGTKVLKQGIPDSAADIEKLDRKLNFAMEQVGGEYEAIYVTDLNGMVYSDGNGGEYKRMSVADRDFYQVAKTGKFNVGTVFRSAKTNEPVVPLSGPIVSSSGEIVGTLTVVLQLDSLVKVVAGTKLGQTGYAFLTDKTGRIVAHPRKELMLELNINKVKGMDAISRKMLTQQTGFEIYEFEGIEKVAGYAPVAITGWSVGTTQPLSEFMAVSNAIRNATLIIGAVLLLATIAALYFFVHTITKPIMRVVEGLNEGADQVAAASGEVSSASQSLAEGSSEQAASLEETSSSLEELASMTRKNADSANEGDTLMKEASTLVKESNGAMMELTASMQAVAQASEETQKIIKTIDAIAFQTNLLALNAAVEAARAGEAGAGFAVVADEVRNLAMRAAEAARNTEALIEETVKRVRDGVSLVIRTADGFSQVVASTGKIGELVAEVSAASHEQAQGIGQINTAVNEMDRVVQQNAANAEQSAAAAEELNAQSQQMRVYVSELTSLVGGSDSEQGNQKSRAFHPPKRTPETNAPTRMVAPLDKNSPFGSGKSVGVRFQRRKEPSPEAVIPFDDKTGEDF